MELVKYTTLDDTTHIIGPSEYTACGLVIPHGNGWVNDQPKKLCSACKSRAKDTQEFGVLQDEAEAETPVVGTPDPEPTDTEDAPAEEKATKDTATSATAKATKSGNKA